MFLLHFSEIRFHQIHYYFHSGIEAVRVGRIISETSTRNPKDRISVIA